MIFGHHLAVVADGHGKACPAVLVRGTPSLPAVAVFADAVELGQDRIDHAAASPAWTNAAAASYSDVM